MKKLNSQNNIRITLSLVTLIFIQMNLFPIIFFNRSENGYIKDDGVEDKPEIIRKSIIIGAKYYLKSYSEYLLFLTKIEMLELDKTAVPDYVELQSSINTCKENVVKAKEIFCNLKDKVYETGYNTDVIKKLKNFDYVLFFKRNHLLETIFKEVKLYLIMGDLRGISTKFCMDIEGILQMIEKIKAKVDLKEFPEVLSLFELSQNYSEAFLFGQYVARIFQEID